MLLEAWSRGHSPERFTNQQVPIFLSLSLNLSSHISDLAGVRPALAAATFVSGLAGIWSFLKQSV
jgi:hypothetical protein